MSSTTGPAKVLGAALVLGAILAAFVASGIGLKQPFRIDEPADLTIAYAVLGAWLVVYLVLAIVVVADAARLARSRDLAAAQDSANLVKLIAIPFFLLNFVALTEVVTVVGAARSYRWSRSARPSGSSWPTISTYCEVRPEPSSSPSSRSSCRTSSSARSSYSG